MESARTMSGLRSATARRADSHVLCRIRLFLVALRRWLTGAASLAAHC